jgi:hypothetical protein
MYILKQAAAGIPSDAIHCWLADMQGGQAMSADAIIEETRQPHLADMRKRAELLQQAWHLIEQEDEGEGLGEGQSGGGAGCRGRRSGH